MREEETSYNQQNNGRLTAVVTSCVDTAFLDTLLKEKEGKLGGKVRRGKSWAPTSWPLGKKKMLEIEKGGYFSPCMKNINPVTTEIILQLYII